MQVMRQATSEADGVLGAGRVLIGDRDPKWTRGVEDLLQDGRYSRGYARPPTRPIAAHTRSGVRHEGAERRRRCNRRYLTAAMLHKR
jgi:hypothetical protein